jgi:hypothetical protein
MLLRRENTTKAADKVAWYRHRPRASFCL